MTTGRINQVRTIARARQAPPARVRAPTRARATPRPGLTPGPLALARQPPACAALSLGPARGLQTLGHVSPRLGGARLGPGAEVPMRGGPRGRSLASPRLLGCVLKRLKILM